MTYLIGLAARSYDPEGALLLRRRDGTNLEDVTRRVSRAKTLDGGVSITNRGHSAGDRTVKLSLEGAPRRDVEAVRRMVQLHPYVTLTTHEGTFTGVPSDYAQSQNELTILVTGET